MSNWYDELSDEQIEQLKNNEWAFGLYGNGWMKEVFARMPYDDREYWSGDNWKRDASEGFVEGWTYRLRQDWARPAPTVVGHWEYRPVIEGAGEWVVDHGEWSRSLVESMNIKGFGGIEYKECPDQWLMRLYLLLDRPATPARVRIWMED